MIGLQEDRLTSHSLLYSLSGNFVYSDVYSNAAEIGSCTSSEHEKETPLPFATLITIGKIQRIDMNSTSKRFLGDSNIFPCKTHYHPSLC